MAGVLGELAAVEPVDLTVGPVGAEGCVHPVQPGYGRFDGRLGDRGFLAAYLEGDDGTHDLLGVDDGFHFPALVRADWSDWAKA